MSDSKEKDDKTKSAKKPAAPEMVEIFIDGQAVQVENGKNLLEAMLDAGEDVSYFCYHPGLSVVAKCRQCLVGIGEGHKLVPSCQLNAKEGLQVRSKTDQVREARRALLEFTLVNHPVDCVICDKAGECALQRQYMDWDGEASLVNHEKVHKPKKVDLGPEIVLDAERCILCHRCVRFCAEVADNAQLLFFHRGDHSELGCAPGVKLDNDYALNTVDICPVGALTDKDFRFKSRVWDLFATRSVCNGCATGCEMEIHHKDGEVYRLVPPKKWDMNLNWMCNDGRRTYKTLGKDRLETPLVDGQESSVEKALAKVIDGFKALREKGDTKIAVVLGADVSNEACFAGLRLARLLDAELYLADKPDDGKGDEILRSNDPNPNRAGAKAIGGDNIKDRAALEKAISDGHLSALYFIGNVELAGAAARKVKNCGLVVSQSPVTSGMEKRAHVTLPAPNWAETDGTLMNKDGVVKRMRPAFEPPGYAKAHWAWLERIGAALGQDAIDSAQGLFSALKIEIAAFAEASWGERMPTKKLRFGGRRG
jgi:NADH-quinone oxidoreductase subunit G